MVQRVTQIVGEILVQNQTTNALAKMSQIVAEVLVTYTLPPVVPGHEFVQSRIID